MSILKIAKMGHPILHQISSPITDFANPKLSVLIEDMIETLEDAGGIGLAAPQVYVPQRIVIFFVPEDRSDEDKESFGVDLTIMLNPKIESLSRKTNIDWEACLSVPSFMGAVERYSHIKYSWMDLGGNKHEREAKGFHARAVQHECDHLDGKLYPMRMSNFEAFGFVEEVNKNRPLMLKGKGLSPDVDNLEEVK
jgi:peptide deformylase